MHVVAIVGSRHRGWSRNVDNEGLIHSIIAPRAELHKDELNIVSIGCDVGMGKAIKDYCDEHGIKFFEFVVYFNGPRSREEYALPYAARHAAVVECAGEFHIMFAASRASSIEDLVLRVQHSGKEYYLYSNQNEVIECYVPQRLGDAHAEA